MSADVSKIKKSVQCNIIFIFEALPENMITSVRMWLFLKILLISKKPAFFFFFFEKKAACTCLTVRKYFTPQMSITKFNTLL